MVACSLWTRRIYYLRIIGIDPRIEGACPCGSSKALKMADTEQMLEVNVSF